MSLEPNQNKKIFIKSMGCKVNHHDSQTMMHQMRARGFDIVTEPGQADIQVINSCSVTEKADRETRYLTRRYKRESPHGKVVVTGCYAQTDSAALTKLSTVDMVVPNRRKTEIVDLLCEDLSSGTANQEQRKMPEGEDPVANNRQGHFKSSLTLFDQTDHTTTRPFLKIQDGCNGFCAYCIIPYARGASRSVPFQQVLAEVTRLVAKGSKEIVLAGIHLGDYGEDLADLSEAASGANPFAHGLRKIMELLPPGCMIRLSSLEPAEVTEDLCRVLSDFSHAICPHFHLPLQSGSDRILKMMRRTYRRDEYVAVCLRLRTLFPTAQLGADVIPGFPGESVDDFAQTLTTINEAGLNYLHVFPYSKRPNTAAFRMPEHLPPEEIKERTQKLIALSKDLTQTYGQSWISRQDTIVWENSRTKDDRPTAKSAHYLSVVGLPGQQVEPGTRHLLKFKGWTAAGAMLGLHSTAE
jgi:threonylcarbamoyladenosine tRNA methylthiotransferase MtaB